MIERKPTATDRQRGERANKQTNEIEICSRMQVNEMNRLRRENVELAQHAMHRCMDSKVKTKTNRSYNCVCVCVRAPLWPRP